MTAEIDELKLTLTEVQSHLAFQEDTISALNESLTRQQRDILTLRRQLELLKQRLDEQAAGQASSTAVGMPDEKPPHY